MQGNPKQINYDDPAWISQNTLDQFGNSQEAIDHLKMILRTASKNYSKEGKEGLTKAIDMISSGEVKPKGNLYNISLEWPDKAREAVDPLSSEHFLQWERPLSEQPEIIQEKFASLKPFNTHLTMAGDPYTALSVSGSDVYNYLNDVYKDPEKASKLLKDIGIPGIRYLDQGSRGAGEGTSNYVVFNDLIPRIVEKLRGGQ